MNYKDIDYKRKEDLYMSFMFNPYPYDDPRAVNHITMSESFCCSVTQTTPDTAKKLIADVISIIEKNNRCVLAIDGFISAPFAQLVGQISIQASLKGIPVTTFSTENLWLDSDVLHDKLLHYLPEDREKDPVLLFGRLYDEGMQGLMDVSRLEKAEKELQDFKENGNGLFILYGNGALISEFRPYYDLKIYMDMTQKRTILNIRAGKCGNIGIKGQNTYNTMIRHSYYVDFEASFPIRREVVKDDIVEYYLTGDHPDNIQMIDTASLKQLFTVMTTYPLRCRPVYIEGVWGGYYVHHLRNLPKEMKNCAWVFDLIPMEVSIVADLGAFQMEFPFYFFVQIVGPELMGEKVAEKFHGYFPIRFNYDDTYHASGNMSVQVHPNKKYVEENNDELGRQDESYYIVVAGQEAKTYCGFTQDLNKEEFLDCVKHAEQDKIPFDHDKYVNSVPSKPGMQFLLPAGTIHASGRNQVILEIGSLTIGSYTYKMYDYLRKDLDGNPRPIHSYHGNQVLDYSRTKDWVSENLVQQPRIVRETEDFTETIVGQHDLIYFSLRNVRFPKRYTDETTDRFHVLVLVEGEQCMIRSLTDPDKYFIQNSLDMVIVPAGFGPYEVINQGVGVVTMHKTLLKEGYEHDTL